MDAWRAADDWPGLGLPAPNEFLTTPALRGATAAARAAPTADERRAAAEAAAATTAFAVAWRPSQPSKGKGKRRKKPPAGDASASKLAGPDFPAPPATADAVPRREGALWVAPRAARFELPKLYVRAREDPREQRAFKREHLVEVFRRNSGVSAQASLKFRTVRTTSRWRV